MVRTTNWLGDAIMGLPALAALGRALPQAELTLLGPAWVADLYAGEPFAHAFLVYPKTFREKMICAGEVRRRRFDAAILLQNSLQAALFAAACRIPHRIGFARDGRSWLLTQALPAPARKGQHERYYYLELLRRAGLLESYPAVDEILLSRAGEARRRGLQKFSETGLGQNVLGLSPGAAFGTAKRWYPERYAETASTLARGHHLTIALFGSASEKPLTEAIEHRLREQGLMVKNFAGQTTLAEFIELAAACRLMLTNDSGAMHVAYATGTPSVTIFGPTDHIGTGPVGPHARLVRHPVECSPCKLRECPIDHRCMQGVTPAMVATEADKILTSRHG
ncbi:MAG: lipopolysaccharide heptosyltransferase II [Bryobacter sp.]